MSVTTALLAFQARDALIATITAEMTSGGRMASLQYVGKSAMFATGKAPACGVIIKGWPDPGPSGQRRLKAVVTLEILLAARSTPTAVVGSTPGKIANLDDAFDTIEPLVDDGNGNGLVAILNDRATFALPAEARPVHPPRAASAQPSSTASSTTVTEQSVWLYFSSLLLPSST